MLRIVRSNAAPAAGIADHQRRVDELVSAVRSDTSSKRPAIFKPAPLRPGASSDPLDRRIVEEVECIRRHIELLGGILANDPILLHRHGRQLQSIDLINQVLGHITRVIAAEDKELTVQQVSMQDLRARLERKPLRPIAS